MNDPLTLAIVCLIVGMMLGAALAALGVMISVDLHKDDPVYPDEADLDQMCLWYDAEYGQKGAHEK